MCAHAHIHVCGWTLGPASYLYHEGVRLRVRVRVRVGLGLRIVPYHEGVFKPQLGGGRQPKLRAERGPNSQRQLRTHPLEDLGDLRHDEIVRRVRVVVPLATPPT